MIREIRLLIVSVLIRVALWVMPEGERNLGKLFFDNDFNS